MVLTDIVKRNYMSTSRKAGAAISAGDLVYLSGTDEVTKTANESCSGGAFEGVAMDSVSSGSYLSVAVEPSEVYVNASGGIRVGQYVTPSLGAGQICNYSFQETNVIVVGRAIEGAAAGSNALIRLMNVPNASVQI